MIYTVRPMRKYIYIVYSTIAKDGTYDTDYVRAIKRKIQISSTSCPVGHYENKQYSENAVCRYFEYFRPESKLFGKTA